MFWFLLSTKQLSFLSTHSSILHSVVSILTSIWNHLSCTWKIAITFLPMLMNSFTFSMCVEVFSNLHFEVFPSVWNSKLIIFPFRVLNMLLHCRLVWIIGAGNLPSLITLFLYTCFCSITHNFVPLYMFLFFSGCFKDFSFPWLIWLWYSLGVYSFLHIFVLGFHWVGSVDTGFVVLFKVEIFLAIVFVKYLFCIFSPLFLKLQLHISYIIHVGFSQLFHSSLMPFYFLPSFFILRIYFSLLIFSFMLFDVFPLQLAHIAKLSSVEIQCRYLLKNIFHFSA